MGNTSTRTVVPLLEAVYSGPVIGITEGVILANKPETSALDPRLVESMLTSLGKIEDIVLVSSGDLVDFEVEIEDPETISFTPFFFNRGSEYGPGHTYYEALCHAFPHRKIIKSSSARYFNKREGKGIGTPHLPATYSICAFIESLRKINAEFLNELKLKLLGYAQTTREKISEEKKQESTGEKESEGESDEKASEKNSAEKKQPEKIEEKREKTIVKKPEISDEAVEELIEGVWRNIAVQIHMGNPSADLQRLMHFDHVFSALHMAITLNGSRNVGFGLRYENHEIVNHVLALKPGDVYCTTPAGILHGVCTSDVLEPEQRSVALQCRTLFSKSGAFVWNGHVSKLCCLVTEVFQVKPVRIPTFAEYETSYNNLISQVPNTNQSKKFKFVNEVNK